MRKIPAQSTNFIRFDVQLELKAFCVSITNQYVGGKLSSRDFISIQMEKFDFN
jgi:hypothetical protein